MAEAFRNSGKGRTKAARRAANAMRAEVGAAMPMAQSCVQAAAELALTVESAARHRPRARKLLRVLKDARRVLITTHQYPDPDALASSLALHRLLSVALPGAKVEVSVKGSIGGGYNVAFVQQGDVKFVPWDDAKLGEFDAIVLLDVQPMFKSSPLPEGVVPTAVVDHHRGRGRRPACAFCDIRTDVGATSSIIFSYFMELSLDIPRDLAAMLLFAIETDLAGAAGQPGELDNLALSSLTLLADTRKLYKMRYAPLSQAVYVACYEGLETALCYGDAVVSHLSKIESAETPAVIADFLLRFDKADWALVTASTERSLVLSLRTSSSRASAADVMRKLLRNLGEGGGHRTKAGGSIPMLQATASDVERVRTTLRKRLLRSLRISATRGQRLVPREG